MAHEDCKNCGARKREHISIAGSDLMCPMVFELDDTPPDCFFCDEGWTRVKWDGRYTSRDTCDTDDNFQHIHPEGEPC